MGASIFGFDIGEPTMTVQQVRDKLTDMIADSAYQDGHSYSGEIGSLSIHSFNITNMTISEEEFERRLDRLEKRSGFVCKVESRDRLDGAVLSIGMSGVFKGNSAFGWRWTGEVKTHEKMGQRDRETLTKMAQEFQEMMRGHNEIVAEYETLIKRITDPNNFDKFTATEVLNFKRKLKTSRERIQKRWDAMTERVEKVREKLNPKTTTTRWTGAACCPS